MKKFCESLREQGMAIIKKKLNLRAEQHESYENPKICYICKEKFEEKYFKIKTL